MSFSLSAGSRWTKCRDSRDFAREAAAARPPIGWFEQSPRISWIPAPPPRAVIRAIAEHFPVVLHGVSLSIGSCDPLDLDYLARLKRLADEVKPAWISDHLC